MILTFRHNFKDFQAVPFQVMTPCSVIYLRRHSESHAASVFRGRLINLLALELFFLNFGTHCI